MLRTTKNRTKNHMLTENEIAQVVKCLPCEDLFPHVNPCAKAGWYVLVISVFGR